MGISKTLDLPSSSSFRKNKPRSTETKTSKHSSSSSSSSKPYVSKYLYHKYYRLLFHGSEGRIEIAHPLSKFFKENPDVKLLCSDGTIMTLTEVLQDCNPIYQHQKSSKVVFIDKLIKLQREKVVSERIYFCDACHMFARLIKGNSKERSIKLMHDIEIAEKGGSCDGFKFALSKGYYLVDPSRNKKSNFLLSEADISYDFPFEYKDDISSTSEISSQKRKPLDSDRMEKKRKLQRNSADILQEATTQTKSLKHPSDQNRPIISLELRSLQTSGEHILRGVTEDLPRLRPKGQERLNNETRRVLSGSSLTPENFGSAQIKKERVKISEKDILSSSSNNSHTDTHVSKITLSNKQKDIQPYNQMPLFKIIEGQIIGFKLFEVYNHVLKPFILFIHDSKNEEVITVKINNIQKLLKFFQIADWATLLKLNERGTLERKLKDFITENQKNKEDDQFVIKRTSDDSYFFLFDEQDDEEIIDEELNLEGWSFMNGGLKF